MLLETKNLVKSFGGIMAIKNLSFQVEIGGIIGLIGPNGAGKTTLFNLVTGFLKPDSGLIIFNDKNIIGLKPYEINKIGITRTFQIVKPFSSMTVKDNIAVSIIVREDKKILDIRKVLNKLSTEQKIEIGEILNFIGLENYKDHTAANLPYALKKRLEIGRALASRPKLLLLDEPSSGLNLKELNNQIDLINEIHSQGITIVIIEHIMKVIMNLSHNLIVLSYGEKIAQGTPKDVASNKIVIDAYLGGGN